MSFKAAIDLFGGDEAVASENVPLRYTLYDLAAEYWHTPFVEETIAKMSKKQLMYWLGYREVRARIEEKRQKEAKKGVKKR